MQPLVSILIPAFNAEAWIAETIKSALDQTWSRKEIIIIDDGSTDQTRTVAGRFASRNVRVVTQVNQGAAAARNHALSLSQGDFIQWLDADDLLAPDKIALQMKAFELCQSRRTLLSAAWGIFMSRPRKAVFSPTQLWCDLTPVEWLLRKLDLNLYMQTATWLMCRDLADLSGPWDTRLLGDDDGEYFCRVLLASDGTRFVPDSRVFYRMPSLESLSYVGRSDKKMTALFLSMQLHVASLRSLEDSPRVRAACLKYLQRGLTFFYSERPDLIRQSEQLAAALGGALETPRLPWKYAWIRGLFGWTAAKQAQYIYNRCKSSLLRSWDKALLRLERR
jgi:glycosyltransferase involved in cell wall biosynthesis